jgi:HEAT repeats
MMPNDLEKFIDHNRESFDGKSPSPFVLGRILEQLQPETPKKPIGILIPFRVVRWAAACIVIIAGCVTFLFLRERTENAAIVETKISIPSERHLNSPLIKKENTFIDSIDHDLSWRKQRLIAKLKEQNLMSRKIAVFAGLDNAESPASRISAVSAAGQLQDPGIDVVNALVQTLNSDPNSNVRLAALDGLARFYRENYVRQQLVAALKKQQDPLVQITLINLLVHMRASGIMEQLDRLINDEITEKAVKDCAYSGILQLRSS